MTTFEALSKRRSAYLEAARDNGFEEGLRQLLADLYPDNAHFIYELLQNAEDARANEVIFDLRPDGLRVEHDGARLFDLRDINSITGIGQSTKVDDATSIGKFGVGFKAVFAYTQNPVIHSGEHSFAIHDLFVPERVPADGRPGLTTFWFPFDRADKPATQAANEIAQALREISGTTLLFLNNIQVIACLLPDGDERLLERRALDEHVIQIESTYDGNGPSYWYRVTGDVDVDNKIFPAAAAFGLEAHAIKPSSRQPKRYSVTPINGQVFIYFPAIKETSGLKFHIHAPFASTVARDSVRDDPGNDTLVEGIADLVTDALPTMRDAGLITDGLLAALPNHNDELPPRYTVLRDRITAAFNTESLTPKVGGGHAPSSRLLRSVRSIRSTLSIDDANLLRGISMSTGDAPPTGWLPERDGRGGAFLDSLDAVSFGPEELAGVFHSVASIYGEVAYWGEDADEYVDDVDRNDLTSWRQWISDKSDDWLRRLYTALGSLSSRQLHRAGIDSFAESLASVPIIRVRDGANLRHVPGSDAWLPTDPGLRLDGMVLDSLAVFEADADDADKDETRALRQFYDDAGVPRWDAAAQLDTRLRSYPDEPPAVTEQHLADLNTLQQLIDTQAVVPRSYADRRFLVALRPDGTTYWASPTGVYIDDPFETTGLTALYQSDDYIGAPHGKLAPQYAAGTFDVAALAKELGATTGLTIDQVPVWDNPQFNDSWRWGVTENFNMVERDWLIPHFDVITAIEDELLLRALWNVVASAKETHAEAIYRANMSNPVHRMASQLLQALREVPWILDRDGNLRLPEDMTADELPQGLQLPTKAPLLELAGFGRKAAINAKRFEDDERRAQELGFESAEVMHEVVEAYRENPDAFKEWLRERKLHSLPHGPSARPEQRAKHAEELSADAPPRRYDKRLRSVHIQEPGHRSAAKGYLTQHYTNVDGIMICQVCSAPMPFKIDGDYYFEAVQFITNSNHDLLENRLALCPTCAAKYRHARNTPLEDLRDDLLTQDVGHQGSLAVDVVLAGQPAKIRFVGKHAIDLQGALNATKIGSIEDDEADDFDT